MTLTAVRPPANTLVVRAAALVVPLAVAGLVFWIAFAGGSYSLASRNAIAIAVWWGITLAVGLSVWPLAPIPGAAILTGGLIAAFALVTGLSVIWAESEEKAFAEANRVVLYLGVFAVAVLAGSRLNAARWSNGIALGVVAVALVALGSRLFPGVFPESDLAPFLPAEQTRLNYPMNYWNALAILIAVACPLLVRAAVATRAPLGQAAALAPFPALAATVYLTSSRTGSITMILGVLCFVVLTARRWAAVGAVIVAGAGAAAALAVLLARNELVSGPLDSEAAESQGRSAALLILLACVATGAAYALGRRYLPGALRPGRRTGWATAAIVILVALVAVAASNPVERFEDFKTLPASDATTVEDPIRAHLTSASGNGRWQWWASSFDQFQAHPILGGGAGSYEAWWAQNGSIPSFVRDAHSLYLETLGELGIVGFALLAAAFATGIVVGTRRVLATDDDGRTLIAGFLAAFLAYAVAAGVDWMWEIPAVSLIAFACLGFVVGPATEPIGRAHDADEKSVVGARRGYGVLRPAAALALITLGPFVIATEAIPLFSTLEIRASQEAVSRRDAGQALKDARAAQKLQPWAASPYLQLALVTEQTGDLAAAHAWIREALERDDVDWRLWLVRARVETKRGDIAEARRSLDRAAALNPRSPLFAGRA